ncbi:TniQ family protein [Streptomyces chrestomyceticus]|uniref:TniQ family protein n=1 Tax=Streptomyces chrestomyceticus TaxID=68185 RepID=A0ABU7WUM1_9ACTN
MPVNVRPRLGETTIHYVQRLARANHLKPSYLISILTTPTNTKTHKVKLDRLATLSGRSTDVLKNTLANTAPPRPTRVHVHTAATVRLERIASRKARSRGFNIVGQIKRDARTSQDTLRQITTRWHLPRWITRKILNPHFPDRSPAGTITLSEELYSQLVGYHEQGMTAVQAWHDLLDNHGTWLSITSVQHRFRLIGQERKTARTHLNQ